MLTFFSSLLQQYPSTVVVAAFISGGCLGFLAAALCVVAHEADQPVDDRARRLGTHP